MATENLEKSIEIWANTQIGSLRSKPTFGLKGWSEILGINKGEYSLIVHLIMDKVIKDLGLDIATQILRISIVEDNFIFDTSTSRIEVLFFSTLQTKLIKI